jgi:2-succinyl-5-enolpyruvyl-6-hydroxy-3-cyclohexene-1-carboxylate synthase
LSGAAGSNAHWAYLIVEELVRCQVTTAILAPGSRSTPLVLAAARNGEMHCTVCHDERGAAFRALGHARATGRPAAVVCTSGTAVANMLPAVIEASLDHQPLLIISADRPIELLDAGANQAILQPGMFAGYVRWQTNLSAPTAAVDASAVLTTIDQAVHRTLAGAAGPVHINCQFREPLETAADPALQRLAPARWRSSGQPYTTYAAADGNWHPGPALIAALTSVDGGLLIAGRGVSSAAATLERLAAALGWPLLADITSGARGTPGLQLLLQTAVGRRQLSTDMVVQFGATPVAKGLQLLLSDAPPRRYIQVSEAPNRLDPGHLVSERIQASPRAAAAALLEAVATRSDAVGPGTLTLALDTAAAAAWTAVNDHLATAELSEPATAQLVATFPERPVGLFLANSMPVRDVDTFATPLAADIPRAANRGASGIDGTVASAAGFAAGLGYPVLLLIGDLALLHDVSSLGQLATAERGLVIVLANNQGGGIFSLLPVAASVEATTFERYFAAPQRVAFDAVAAAFGLSYTQPRDRAALQTALAAGYTSALTGQSSLVEVRTERGANAQLHRELNRLVEATIAGQAAAR